jgi:hypothetical protein
MIMYDNNSVSHAPTVVSAGTVFNIIAARVPEGTPGNTGAVLAATGVAVVAGAAAATAAAGVIVVNQVTILEPKNIATMPNSITTPIISAVEVLLSPAPARLFVMPNPIHLAEEQNIKARKIAAAVRIRKGQADEDGVSDTPMTSAI